MIIIFFFFFFLFFFSGIITNAPVAGIAVSIMARPKATSPDYDLPAFIVFNATDVIKTNILHIGLYF